MSYLDFSKIKNYLDLQDIVFSLDIPYQTLKEKYDLELAYQNRFDKNFDWKKIERSNEEIKMNMDLGEVIPLGPSNRNQTQDRGKRPRFEPVPPSGEDDGPGRPIRSGTSRYDYNDDSKNYRFRGSMEPIEKITLVSAHQNGTISTINLNNPQIWESVISKWEFDAVRAWANSDKQGVGDMFAFLETLLGETAANIYNEAKIKKAGEIETLRQLGDNPYNFTKFIRTLILGFDPSRQNTNMQDQAYRNLEQLSIDNW